MYKKSKTQIHLTHGQWVMKRRESKQGRKVKDGEKN